MIEKMYKVGDPSPYSAIGDALKTLSQLSVKNFDGVTNIGFGYENCNAAVAVEAMAAANKGYRDGPTNVIGLDFHVVYGSSRLYAGLDPVGNNLVDTSLMTHPFSSSSAQQHAEQTAILIASERGFPFWTTPDGFTHVYVDFTPCDKCEPWLKSRPETWIVHYNVLLQNKTVHIKERKDISRQYKKMNTTNWKEFQKKRLEQERIAKKAAIMASARGQS